MIGSVHTGDRLDVVLDVYMDDNAYRVVLIGIYPPGAKKPDWAPPGAVRNVVQSWLGKPHHARVFQLPFSDASDETGTSVSGQS